MDEYRAVTVTLRQLRVDAIMAEHPRVQGWVAIPRSLIHGGDDLKLSRTGKPGDEATFRLMSWKADQLRLA